MPDTIVVCSCRPYCRAADAAALLLLSGGRERGSCYLLSPCLEPWRAATLTPKLIAVAMLTMLKRQRVLVPLAGAQLAGIYLHVPPPQELQLRSY